MAFIHSGLLKKEPQKFSNVEKYHTMIQYYTSVTPTFPSLDTAKNHVAAGCVQPGTSGFKEYNLIVSALLLSVNTCCCATCGQISSF